MSNMDWEFECPMCKSFLRYKLEDLEAIVDKYHSLEKNTIVGIKEEEVDDIATSAKTFLKVKRALWKLK